MIFVKIVWEKVKKNWKIVLAVLGAIAAVIFGAVEFGGGGGNLSKKIADLNKAHDDAIKQIKEAGDERTAKTVIAAETMSKTLEAVQQQYQAQNKQLDDVKKQQIAALIQNHNGNEDELLQKLAGATGFPVVLPSK